MEDLDELPFFVNQEIESKLNGVVAKASSSSGGVLRDGTQHSCT